MHIGPVYHQIIDIHYPQKSLKINTCFSRSDALRLIEKSAQATQQGLYDKNPKAELGNAESTLGNLI